MRIEKMAPQKQNVHHQIPLLLLLVLVGISSFGINVVEARLGTSFITCVRLLGRQGVEVVQPTDSSSRAAARLLQSVPSKVFHSVKSKGIIPPSGPSGGGNSYPLAAPSDQPPPVLPPCLPSPIPERESKMKGNSPVSGPSHGSNSSPWAAPSDQSPPAPPPPPPSPTLVYP